MKNYQEWMCNVFYYFKRSAQREKQLHKVQSLLDHLTLKYREILVLSVRWMSFYETFEEVFRTLDPLLTYLHSRGPTDPTASFVKVCHNTVLVHSSHDDGYHSYCLKTMPYLSKRATWCGESKGWLLSTFC